MRTLPRIAVSALALAMVAAPHAASAAASSDLATLKAQVKELSAKVQSLETEQKAEAAKPAPVTSADVVTKGSFPGSFKVPGTETSVKFGGYVKADMINDVGQSYDSSFSVFRGIPLDGTIQKDRSFDTHFSAKQTRLNMETRTNTSLGEMKTFVEVDFFGGNASNTAGTGAGNGGQINNNLNGYTPQLRLAYGSLAGWTAGQNWSNFMDTAAASESLDYLGSAGRVFVRQGQIAYAHDFGPVKASASVEGRIMNDNIMANDAFTNISTGNNGSGRMTMPDITLRGDYKYAKDGYVSLRSLFVMNNIDHNATGSTDNHDATKFGYGFGVSGVQGTVDKDTFRYDLNYGNGTGRYLFDIDNQALLYNTARGKIYAAKYFDATAGYQHMWSEQFRSNFFGGYLRKINNLQEAGASAANAAAINKYVASGHVNLIWQPAPAYSVGVEYMHGYRKVESGTEGNLNRFVTSFQYKF